MADLVFTTQGQAEALAAQEAIANKGRAIRDEFEQGAKSVGQWDSQLGRLKSAAEGALRSIQTEQEKIAQQIADIEKAQIRGMIPPEEAEQAITRLKERWVEVDEATKKQAEDTEKTARAHEELKRSAEHAIESVATPAEQIAEKIKGIGEEAAKVRQAMAAGLVPHDIGEETIKRLNERMVELKGHMTEVEGTGEKAGSIINHLFGEHAIVHAVGAYASIHGLIHIIKGELEDMQQKIDARQAQLLKPAERVEKLKADEEESYKSVEQAHTSERDAKQALQKSEEAAAKESVAKQHEIDEAKKQVANTRADVDRVGRETTEAFLERHRKHEEEVGDADLQIKRAKENYIRHPGIETQREMADAAKRRLRINEDYVRDDKKATEAEEHRNAEAKRSQETAESHLDELNRQAGDTPESVIAARREVEERRRASQEAEEKHRQARQARIEQEYKAESQRAQKLKAEKEAIDTFNEEVAQAGDDDELPSDVRESVNQGLREIGYPRIARQTPAERKALIERLKHEGRLERSRVESGIDVTSSTGDVEPYTADQLRRMERIAIACEKAAAILEQLQQNSQDNGGMTNGPE
jgi:hypothetical protein